MTISIFQLFSIGIGPSSSHTVGPMRATNDFINQIKNKKLFDKTQRVACDLYGSLALTGHGHGTDKAILLGLLGNKPESVNPEQVDTIVMDINQNKKISLAGEKYISFDINNDLNFHKDEFLPQHSNGMRLSAFDKQNDLLFEQVYFSIGGGFILKEEEIGKQPPEEKLPFPFNTAEELLTHCKKQNCSIAKLMLENEKTWHSEKEIREQLLMIAQVMVESIKKGCQTEGVLPGPLKVKRRAAELYKKLSQKGKPPSYEHSDVIDWLNMFAIAVNEQNAAGQRIVTAPTNGAAGVIPAVMHYYQTFYPNVTDDDIIDFLLTAGAIAILYKKGASLSAAEVGCQGEIGVASSMAAGALTAVLDGTLDQIENAAEIAMEHHLGMTCDPVGGLVQIPCIERNTMGALKAVNAYRLAKLGDGQHKVPLDKVIKTMLQTGKDMQTIYKETSQGGLAVNVIEC